MGARRTVAADLDDGLGVPDRTGPDLVAGRGRAAADAQPHRAAPAAIRLDAAGHDRSPPILQLTVLQAKTGTTIAFHQERLTGREQRKEMLTHWHGVLERLEEHFAG